MYSLSGTSFGFILSITTGAGLSVTAAGVASGEVGVGAVVQDVNRANDPAKVSPIFLLVGLSKFPRFDRKLFCSPPCRSLLLLLMLMVCQMYS